MAIGINLKINAKQDNFLKLLYPACVESYNKFILFDPVFMEQGRIDISPIFCEGIVSCSRFNRENGSFFLDSLSVHDNVSLSEIQEFEFESSFFVNHTKNIFAIWDMSEVAIVFINNDNIEDYKIWIEYTKEAASYYQEENEKNFGKLLEDIKSYYSF